MVDGPLRIVAGERVAIRYHGHLSGVLNGLLLGRRQIHHFADGMLVPCVTNLLVVMNYRYFGFGLGLVLNGVLLFRQQHRFADGLFIPWVADLLVVLSDYRHFTFWLSVMLN